MKGSHLDDEKEEVRAKYSTTWRAEQLRLRQQLVTRDSFPWAVPKNARLEPYKNAPANKARIMISRHGQGGHKRKQESRPLRFVGGVDISPTHPGSPHPDKACAALVVCEWPSLRVVHKESAIVDLEVPYIAGFLAFREARPLLRLIDQVREEHPAFLPDVIIVDGNGYLHYRRFGLASHLGVLSGIPTIGLAKQLLRLRGLRSDEVMQACNRDLTRVGDCCEVRAEGEVVGAAVRLTHGAPIVYVSIGHRVSLETALKVTRLCCPESNHLRLPVPTSEADRLTRAEMRTWERKHQPISFAGKGTPKRDFEEDFKVKLVASKKATKPSSKRSGGGSWAQMAKGSKSKRSTQ